MKKLVGIFFAAMLGLNSAWAAATPSVIGFQSHDINETLGMQSKSGSGSIYGGAFEVTSSGSITHVAGTFYTNSSESIDDSAYGGAISNRSDRAILGLENHGIGSISVEFLGNSAKSNLGNAYGGAIYNASEIVNSISGTMFRDNYVDSGGIDGQAFGGAIHNNGEIGSIVTGSFEANYAKATGVNGQAFGGAIYNYGNINGGISSNFTDNYAEALWGEAFGGAIYTINSIDFSADGKAISFNNNYTNDTRGKIYNAIYVSGNGLSLGFDTRNTGSITLKDQIEGGANYDIRITGDGTGRVEFDNLIVGAKNIRVENTDFILGSVLNADAAFKGSDNYNHGVFVGAQDPNYSSYAASASMSLDNSNMTLNYVGSAAPDLNLTSLTMKNGSVVNLGTSILSAGEYSFYGIENEIKGTAVNMDFKNLDLSFHIPGTAVNDDTMLKVYGDADIDGSRINIGIDGGSSSLVAGDKINLIEATGGSLTGAIDESATGGLDIKITQGVSLVYGLDLDHVGNKLVVEVIGKELKKETKSFSEGSLAGLAFVNQSADLVAGAGISNAVKSAKNARSDFGVFGAAAGGKSRYKTGSHVDIDGFSIMAGFAGAVGRDFTLGGFIEYGSGNYNSFNEFAGMDPVKAKGDMNYTGGGVFAHLDVAGGLYVEGSVRGGRIKNNFESGDFSDAPIAAFDATAGYFGGHAGLGYLSELAGGSELDTSVKYLATMQEKYDAKVSAGETIKFDSVFSQRVRAGTVLRIGNGFIRPFVGAAADYEFGAEQKASIYGLDVEAPMISGLTGIGQAGLAIETNDLTLSLGGEGYLGARQGFGAMLSFKYRFGAKEQAPEPETQNDSVRASSMFTATAPEPQAVRAMSAFAAPVESDRNITHAVEAAGNYIVQVGAFYNEDMAEQAKNQVSYLGTPTVKKGKGDMYRVQFRNLSTEDANRIMETLENDEGMKPGLIKGGRWQHRRRGRR